jgi:hypothetical protein
MLAVVDTPPNPPAPSPPPLPSCALARLLATPSLGSATVRYFTAGYCGTTPSSRGYPEGDGVLPTRCRRGTARGGRSMFLNDLDGTLPAELGKLTDLEDLCAALRRCCCRAALRRTGRRRTHAPRWCAAHVARTSCAARSAAGSARWRSSPFCKRPSPPTWLGARCDGTAGTLVRYDKDGYRGALAGTWQRTTWTARCRRSSASSRTSSFCA